MSTGDPGASSGSIGDIIGPGFWVGLLGALVSGAAAMFGLPEFGSRQGEPPETTAGP
jgi:hypothetical protein